MSSPILINSPTSRNILKSLHPCLTCIAKRLIHHLLLHLILLLHVIMLLLLLLESDCIVFAHISSVREQWIYLVVCVLVTPLLHLLNYRSTRFMITIAFLKLELDIMTTEFSSEQRALCTISTANQYPRFCIRNLIFARYL